MLSGAGGPGPQRRTRRHRTIFSEEQLQALEALFVQNQYPDVGTRERLAGRIRLREERVEVGARLLYCQRVQRVQAGWLPFSLGKDGRGSAWRREEAKETLGPAGRGAGSWEGRTGTGTCGEISVKLEGK